MNIKQIGIDIGKMTFHMVALDEANDIVIRRQFTRSQLITFFTKRADEGLNVAFEACSGAHWLAHQLIGLGHEVRLLTPESVKPFAKAQKNDWNDALAIAEAATRPGRHAVGVKSQEQLDMQALHRVRQRLVTSRTALINQIRGLLRERGLVFRSGRAQFEAFARDKLLSGDVELNPVCRTLFASLITEYKAISARLEEIDQELTSFAKTNAICRALLPVPGVGVIVATALFSAIANISDFKTGRDLAAFLGLVPRQRSTGGKTVLLGISKRGNTYIRTLLIHGMRSAFYNRKKRQNEVTAFMERLNDRGMHTNKIVVASANKAARIIWAVLSKNTDYRSHPA
jgi:transposase